MESRINGFEQIKSFYSWVFNNPDKVRPTHISLYLFLWNQANRANWVEWFKCPYDLAMQGACIGNKGTYYRALDELKSFNLIDYKKGVNNYKAPQIKLFKLYKSEPLHEQVSVPQSEPLPVPQSEPLPVPIYKLITSNLKLITNNINKLELFIESLKDNKVFPFEKSLLDLGVEKQIVSDWLKVRKLKKAVNSETAFNNIKTQIEKSGLSANECIKISVENSWSGFKYEWVKNDKSHSLNNNDSIPSRLKGMVY